MGQGGNNRHVTEQLTGHKGQNGINGIVLRDSIDGLLCYKDNMKNHIANPLTNRFNCTCISLKMS